MSGTQGPLETRAKTTVDTAASLAGLDATPWDSGELAYVRATGATYELIREDTTSQIDGFNFLAVAPQGSVGRWRRVCLSCTGATGSTGGCATACLLYFTSIPADAIRPSVLAGDTVTILSLAVNAPVDADYFIIGSGTFVGQISGESAPTDFISAEFVLVVDGNALEENIGTSINRILPNGFGSYPDAVAVQGAVHLTAGLHTIELQVSPSSGQGINPPTAVTILDAELSAQPFMQIQSVIF